MWWDIILKLIVISKARMQSSIVVYRRALTKLSNQLYFASYSRHWGNLIPQSFKIVLNYLILFKRNISSRLSTDFWIKHKRQVSFFVKREDALKKYHSSHRQKYIISVQRKTYEPFQFAHSFCKIQYYKINKEQMFNNS